MTDDNTTRPSKQVVLSFGAVTLHKLSLGHKFEMLMSGKGLTKALEFCLSEDDYHKVFFESGEKGDIGRLIDAFNELHNDRVEHEQDQKKNPSDSTSG